MISYESSYSILIGHRIRNERIALGMTQSEFAKLLGISPSYLGALERGTRPVSRSIMNRLHEKTHISYDYLLEGLEKPDDTIPSCKISLRNRNITVSAAILGFFLPPALCGRQKTATSLFILI